MGPAKIWTSAQAVFILIWCVEISQQRKNSLYIKKRPRDFPKARVSAPVVSTTPETPVPVASVSWAPEPVALTSASRKKLALARPEHSSTFHSSISSPLLPPLTLLLLPWTTKGTTSWSVWALSSMHWQFFCCDTPPSVTEDRVQKGVGVKGCFCCTVCGKQSCVTDTYHEEDLKVNNRSVLAMRAIGKGRAGLEKLLLPWRACCPPVSKPIFIQENEKIRLC